MKNKWVKTTAVVVGAVGLTTLAISASDLARGISGNLPGMAIESTGPCQAYETYVQFGANALCIDTYEASVADSCPVPQPQNEIDTQANVTSNSCLPESKPEALPWRYVSLTQAQQLCARAGKRVLSSAEWYTSVSGHTEINSCAIDGGLKKTGASGCVSPAGIEDMIGNVWEWVDGEVVDGIYHSLSLPESGYVALVSSEGMVLETTDRPVDEFGKDYAITDTTGVRGIIRGGFYGSGEDAGIFSINASVPLNFRAAGVGFRCARDV